MSRRRDPSEEDDDDDEVIEHTTSWRPLQYGTDGQPILPPGTAKKSSTYRLWEVEMRLFNMGKTNLGTGKVRRTAGANAAATVPTRIPPSEAIIAADDDRVPALKKLAWLHSRDTVVQGRKMIIFGMTDETAVRWVDRDHQHTDSKARLAKFAQWSGHASFARFREKEESEAESEGEGGEEDEIVVEGRGRGGEVEGGAGEVRRGHGGGEDEDQSGDEEDKEDQPAPTLKTLSAPRRRRARVTSPSSSHFLSSADEEDTAPPLPTRQLRPRRPARNHSPSSSSSADESSFPPPHRNGPRADLRSSLSPSPSAAPILQADSGPNEAVDHDGEALEYEYEQADDPMRGDGSGEWEEHGFLLGAGGDVEEGDEQEEKSEGTPEHGIRTEAEEKAWEEEQMRRLDGTWMEETTEEEKRGTLMTLRFARNRMEGNPKWTGCSEEERTGREASPPHIPPKSPSPSLSAVPSLDDLMGMFDMPSPRPLAPLLLPIITSGFSPPPQAQIPTSLGTVSSSLAEKEVTVSSLPLPDVVQSPALQRSLNLSKPSLPQPDVLPYPALETLPTPIESLKDVTPNTTHESRPLSLLTSHAPGSVRSPPSRPRWRAIGDSQEEKGGGSEDKESGDLAGSVTEEEGDEDLDVKMEDGMIDYEGEKMTSEGSITEEETDEEANVMMEVDYGVHEDEEVDELAGDESPDAMAMEDDQAKAMVLEDGPDKIRRERSVVSGSVDGEKDVLATKRGRVVKISDAARTRRSGTVIPDSQESTRDRLSGPPLSIDHPRANNDRSSAAATSSPRKASSGSGNVVASYATEAKATTRGGEKMEVIDLTGLSDDEDEEEEYPRKRRRVGRKRG